MVYVSITTFVVPYLVFSLNFVILVGDLVFSKWSNLSLCSGEKQTALTTLSLVWRLQSKYLYFLSPPVLIGETEWTKQLISLVFFFGETGKHSKNIVAYKIRI